MNILLFSITLAAVAMLLFLTLISARAAKKASAVYISLTAVLTALSVVGRIAFAPVAGFKPCTAVIIIAGVSLGAPYGFICGALTALTSNLYFGQGYWTLFQMLSWGLIGYISGVFSDAFRKNKAFLYLFAAFSGVLFSLIMDVYSTAFTADEFTLSAFALYAAGSAPFCVIYAASNIIFLMLLYEKLTFSVGRVVKKYG